jgi:AcrR family transcriptional regulator
VPPVGLEPTHTRLKGGRSDQLSYGGYRTLDARAGRTGAPAPPAGRSAPVAVAAAHLAAVDLGVDARDARTNRCSPTDRADSRRASYSGAVSPAPAQADSPPPRRRRTLEEAEREIIGAAESLLRERPFRELTVDEVMRRTDLSRPSFYVYFRDRHELVWRVVEHLGGEVFKMSAGWFEGGGDGAELAREAIEGVVAVFAEHGPVLRALSDAAAHDPDLEEAYGRLVQGYIDVTARHIEAEVAAGRILPLDPQQTAKALVWMMERYLHLSLGREPLTPAPVVARTLATIVGRILYGSR